MRLSLRAAIAGLALAMLMIAALPLNSQAASHGKTYRTHQAAPACAVVFIYGRQTCYAPANEKKATAGINWAVSPDAAVKAALGLNLAQVSVLRMPSSGVSNDNHPVQVDYLYGALMHDYGRTGGAPLAVRVIEGQGTATPSTRMAPGIPLPVIHQACGTWVEISAAADPEHKHPAYGPWMATANFPHGNHSVAIVANVDQHKLLTLTCGILQAG